MTTPATLVHNATANSTLNLSLPGIQRSHQGPRLLAHRGKASADNVHRRESHAYLPTPLYTLPFSPDASGEGAGG